MQRLTKNTLAGLALIGLFGSAHAVPVSLTEPITDFTSSSGNTSITNQTTTFTFDLTSFGYDTTLHGIDSALLALSFDVSGPAPQQGQDITLDFNGQAPIVGSATTLQGMSPFVLSPADFDLGAGLLAFSLQRENSAGSFSLASASLNLEASLLQIDNPDDPLPGNNPTAIPTPGTLALLGLGLLGSILFTRRRPQTLLAHR